MTFVIDQARPHLGGAIEGGDDATFYPTLWNWLVSEYDIRSVLDVGCGEGHAVEFFSEEGCTVLGVDGIPPAGEHYFAWDYTQGPMPPTQRFDLCWSCEFVEHVEERFLPNFVASFAHCDMILMTHAAPGQPGYHHVNCVIDGTQVASPEINRAFRRRYVGEVVTLMTTEGDELTVTPNHPVATPSGWTAAGLLQEGDKVVGGSDADWVPRCVVPDTYQAPASVEEIFRAMAEVLPSGILSVPTTAEEFHGDGRDGEVDVVGANRQLRNDRDTSFFKHRRESRLSRRTMSATLLSAESAFRLGFLAFDHPSSFIQHEFDPSLPISRRQRIPSAASDLARSQDREAVLLDDSFDGRRTYTTSRCYSVEVFRFKPDRQNGSFVDVKPTTLALRANGNPLADNEATRVSVIDMSLDSELRKRFPCRVALKKLVRVHRSQYVGHVYNFSTPSESYWANGIIVHNCRDAEYWKGVMAGAGFWFNELLTHLTRELAAENEHPLNHYAARGLAFERY